MPLIATRGAASAQGFGEFAQSAAPVYIEDVFSTYLYTGNGSTQTITNGIDLSGEGGLVWWKNRTNATGHGLIDTTRGIDYYLSSNTTDAQDGPVSYISSVSSTGYSIGAGTQFVNQSANNYVSWTFRKQPKFFDVVTYTGNSVAGREIAHNLGSVPGCMIVKSTSDTQDWAVYHRSLGNTKRLVLNGTDAEITSTVWNNTTPTSTVFTVSDNARVNSNGSTYVAYIYAHDAGGFGLTGTDNVISCSSFTTDGSGNATVDLGYEPQWLLVKANASGNDWYMYDNMRGLSYSNYVYLSPNLSAAEGNIAADYLVPTATGFKTKSFAGSTTYIYIAIRRGPMKVPTSGTSVFSPITNSASTGTVNTTGFPVDMGIVRWRDGADSNFLRSRLQGVSSTTTESGAWLKTNATDAESTAGGLTRLWNNTGFQTTSGFSGYSTVYWNFGRAPSFFDEVCYTGTGSATTQTHNLGVVPELMIVKRRSGAANWPVYSATSGNTKYQYLNSTLQADTFNMWNNTTPTASVFSISGDTDVNGSGSTYVAYLFATCAGVSKVGSFTGNGSSQTINCGFTGGARFVLIKKSSGTGDWMVSDSARGIVSGNDPYLELNNTNAEVTGEDWLDTDSTGFVVNEVSGSNANTNGATYIFLAIA